MTAPLLGLDVQFTATGADAVAGAIGALKSNVDACAESLAQLSASVTAAGEQLQTLAPAAETADVALNGVNASAQSLGRTFAGGLSAVIVAQGLEKLAESGIAAEDSIARLDITLRNAGVNLTQYGDQVDDVVRATSAMGLSTETEAREALQRLILITGDAQWSMQHLSTAQDLAAATGRDLEYSAVLLGRAYNGVWTQLERLGFVTKEQVQSGGAMDSLEERIRGATAEINKQSGGLHELWTTLQNDLQSTGKQWIDWLAEVNDRTGVLTRRVDAFGESIKVATDLVQHPLESLQQMFFALKEGIEGTAQATTDLNNAVGDFYKTRYGPQAPAVPLLGLPGAAPSYEEQQKALGRTYLKPGEGVAAAEAPSPFGVGFPTLAEALKPSVEPMISLGPAPPTKKEIDKADEARLKTQHEQELDNPYERGSPEWWAKIHAQERSQFADVVRKARDEVIKYNQYLATFKREAESREAERVLEHSKEKPEAVAGQLFGTPTPPPLIGTTATYGEEQVATGALPKGMAGEGYKQLAEGVERGWQEVIKADEKWTAEFRKQNEAAMKGFQASLKKDAEMVGASLAGGIEAGMAAHKDKVRAAMREMEKDMLQSFGSYVIKQGEYLLAQGGFETISGAFAAQGAKDMAAGLGLIALGATMQGAAGAISGGGGGGGGGGAGGGGIEPASVHARQFLNVPAGTPFAAGEQWPGRGIASPHITVIGPGDTQAQYGMQRLLTNMVRRGMTVTGIGG